MRFDPKLGGLGILLMPQYLSRVLKPALGPLLLPFSLGFPSGPQPSQPPAAIVSSGSCSCWHVDQADTILLLAHSAQVRAWQVYWSQRLGFLLSFKQNMIPVLAPCSLVPKLFPLESSRITAGLCPWGHLGSRDCTPSQAIFTSNWKIMGGLVPVGCYF